MTFFRIAAAAALALAAAGTSAATTTLSGTGFDVTFDDGALGLYGMPSLTGDVLSWFPSGSPGFTAKSSSGSATTSSTFSLVVTAKPGYTITGFGVQEGGDYFFFGAGSSVDVSGELRATPVPGSPSSLPIVATMTFVSNAPLDFSTTGWSAASGTLLVPTGTKTAAVDIANTLSAHADPNSFPAYAYIEKKDVALQIAVTQVPEPQTYALMLAGLGVVGFVAARRRG